LPKAAITAECLEKLKSLAKVFFNHFYIRLCAARQALTTLKGLGLALLSAKMVSLIIKGKTESAFSFNGRGFWELGLNVFFLPTGIEILKCP